MKTAAALRGRVGDEQREVEAAVGLDAGADAGGAKAARRGDAAGDGRDVAAITPSGAAVGGAGSP